MDYRHTEDFARRMESAAYRAQALRAQAFEDFFTRIARMVRALVRRVAHQGRGDKILPEA